MWPDPHANLPHPHCSLSNHAEVRLLSLLSFRCPRTAIALSDVDSAKNSLHVPPRKQHRLYGVACPCVCLRNNGEDQASSAGLSKRVLLVPPFRKKQDEEGINRYVLSRCVTCMKYKDMFRDSNVWLELPLHLLPLEAFRLCRFVVAFLFYGGLEEFPKEHRLREQHPKSIYKGVYMESKVREPTLTKAAALTSTAIFQFPYTHCGIDFTCKWALVVAISFGSVPVKLNYL
eukprot:gene5254-3765_t